MPTLTGLYTDEQLDALQQQTSRGDAVDQIVNHLAARIVETKNSFFAYSTRLNHAFQHDLESATTPWPYSIINWIPAWLRATLCVFFITVLFSLFAQPIYLALLYTKDSALTFMEFLHTVFCGHAATLGIVRAQNLAARLAIDGPEEDPAMLPLVEPRQSTRINALKNQVDTMKASITALESAAKQQSMLNKQLEARLNKLEMNPPPPYTNNPAISAITKDCQNPQARQR